MTKTELLKVIRAHCLDCCCDSYEEVKNCGCPKCNLFPYRFGKDPSRKVLSPEEKEKRVARLRAVAKKSQESNATGVSADAT